ncbi:hypothetical protein Vretimale_17788, partial [Volvox reticuliferus]
QMADDTISLADLKQQVSLLSLPSWLQTSNMLLDDASSHEQPSVTAMTTTTVAAAAAANDGAMKVATAVAPSTDAVLTGPLNHGHAAAAAAPQQQLAIPYMMAPSGATGNVQNG